jgi:phosphatidylserine/phosphatidylglycerophosphate/cardiolipin synthase-like enzyme
VQAKKRGVAVQIVIDREFDLGNPSSKGKFFDTQKIPLRRISGAKPVGAEKDSGLMHQKFAIIDRSVVLAGSYNWTYAAENSNDENLLFFREAAPLAEEYRRAFLRLWERKP